MRTSMTRFVSVASIVLAGASTLAIVGCKGEKVIQPDPRTQEDLASCLKAKDEKDKLCKTLEDENARLLREKGSGAEIVVSIEGNLMTVKPAKPGEVRPPGIDDKVVGEASKQ